MATATAKSGMEINHATMRPGERQNQRLKRPLLHRLGAHSGLSSDGDGSTCATLARQASFRNTGPAECGYTRLR
jgi:hypothetical protein